MVRYMANQSDGRVIIDTEMNTKPLEISIDNIRKMLNRASGAFSQLGENIKNTFNRLRFSNQIGAEVEKTKQELRSINDEILKVRRAQDAFLASGGKVDSTKYQNMEAQLARLRARYDDLQAYQEDVARGAINMSESYTGMQYISPLLSRVKDGIKGVARGALQGAVNLAKMAGRGVVNGFKKLGGALRSVWDHLHKTNSGGFGGGFKNILKYAFGIRSLFVLFNRLRNALVDGFKTLVTYDGETNKSISTLKDSLGQLKNSFASAFAPILNAIAPALNFLIGKLTQAVSAIAQFMSALTGKSTYFKATKGQSDFAKSLDKTGQSAKKATTYLSGLDEVTRFTTENANESGAGAGSEGGFEETAIESRFTDLADKVKGFFKNEDWEGLGAWVASGINKGVQKIYDVINWENVGPRITKFVNAFTTTFNSLVDNIDFENIGRTFGAGINTILHTVDLLITGIDWGNLGTKLGDIIDGAVKEIEWAKIGETLSNGIKGFFEFWKNFYQNTDWFELGKGIWTSIKNIDWGGIASALFETIGSVLGAIGSFIRGLLQEAWTNVVTWWKETAYKDGKFTMEGLLLGIWDLIKNIGTWIYDHIFVPFIDGFKKAFGIASPSKVMQEMGNFLMQGLYNGISALVNKVISLFTNIKNGIVNIWNNLKSATTSIWEGIKNAIRNPINAIIGFINRMISGVVSGINAVTGTLNRLSFTLPDWAGGYSIGFNIPRISASQIPYLASGAVIPPNAPFMAVLGDQRNGTNIEAPLETIKQAVAEVIGANNKGGEYVFTAQINRRTLFEEIIDEAKIRQATTARNPFDLVRG